MTPPRVFVIGSQLGLEEQTDIGLIRGFRQAGCEVSTYDYRATTFVPRVISRLVPKAVKARLSPQQIPVVAKADAAMSNTRLLAAARRAQPDLIVALQAERVEPSTLAELRGLGAVMMNWILDEPEGRVAPDTVPLYDVWLVWDEGVAPWLAARGAKRVAHMPMACDPSRHRPVSLTAAEKIRWASRICFVGGYGAAREQWLAPIAEFGLGVWGPGWHHATDPMVRRCVRSANHVPRQEWLKIYAAAEIVMNIQAQGRDGVNLRMWEALAAGACVVSDYRADIDRLLPDVVATFQNAEDLRRVCGALLDDDARRRRMAEDGRRLVLARHTFRHRAEAILRIADEARKSRA